MATYSQIDLRSFEDITAVREIVYTLDLAGNFTFLNAEGERLSGYSCDEAKRLHITEVVAPEFAACVQMQLRQMITQPIGAVYEIEIITKDRRRIPLETSIHLLVRDGQPVAIHGIALPPVGTLANARTRCLDENFAFGAFGRIG